jgi:hypothetical protein
LGVRPQAALRHFLKNLFRSSPGDESIPRPLDCLIKYRHFVPLLIFTIILAFGPDFYIVIIKDCLNSRLAVRHLSQGQLSHSFDFLIAPHENFWRYASSKIFLLAHKNFPPLHAFLWTVLGLTLSAKASLNQKLIRFELLLIKKKMEKENEKNKQGKHNDKEYH